MVAGARFAVAADERRIDPLPVELGVGSGGDMIVKTTEAAIARRISPVLPSRDLDRRRRLAFQKLIIFSQVSALALQLPDHVAGADLAGAVSPIDAAAAFKIAEVGRANRPRAGSREELARDAVHNRGVALRRRLRDGQQRIDVAPDLAGVFGGDQRQRSSDALGGARHLSHAVGVEAICAEQDRRDIRRLNEILQVRPFFGLLRQSRIAAGFQHFGGAEHGDAVERSRADEFEERRGAPSLDQRIDDRLAGLNRLLNDIGELGDSCAFGIGRARGQSAARLADAQSRQQQRDLRSQVGADARHNHAGQLIGQGRHGRLEELVGDSVERSAGIAGQGDSGRAGQSRHIQRFNRAADLAGDRDADDQIRLRSGRGQVASRIAAERQRTQSLRRHAGQLVESQLGADRGVVAVAAADQVDALDGRAGLEVEGAAGGGVEGFDDGADELGQGVDLLVHGGACGHGLVLLWVMWRWY